MSSTGEAGLPASVRASASSSSRPGWGTSPSSSPPSRSIPSSRLISESACRPVSWIERKRLDDPFGRAFRDLLAGACLDDHDAERVRDHVVQLARDPGAFLLDGGLPLAFEPRGAFRVLGGFARPAVQRPSHEPGRDQEQRNERSVSAAVRLAIRDGELDRGEDPGKRGREADRGARQRLVLRDRVNEDQADHDRADAACAARRRPRSRRRAPPTRRAAPPAVPAAARRARPPGRARAARSPRTERAARRRSRPCRGRRPPAREPRRRSGARGAGA